MVGAADAGQLIMIGVLMLSSLLNVVYLLSPVAKGFFLTGADNNQLAESGVNEAPFWCLMPPVFTAFGCLVLFFYGGEVSAFLAPIAGSAEGVSQ